MNYLAQVCGCLIIYPGGSSDPPSLWDDWKTIEVICPLQEPFKATKLFLSLQCLKQYLFQSHWVLLNTDFKC